MLMGDDGECEHIRDALDTGRDFELGAVHARAAAAALVGGSRDERVRVAASAGARAEGSSTAVHSMASTLLTFLEALPEPVIPFAFYQRCLDANQTAVLAKQVCVWWCAGVRTCGHWR